MSEENDQEKTEQPTEKKLRDAAEKGDLPSSREAPLFASLLALLLVSSLMLRDSTARLVDILSRLLDDPGQWRLGNGADAAILFGIVFRGVGGFLVPIFLIFIVAGLAIAFAQHMPSVVLDRIAPKLSKISPTAGAGRLFGTEGLMQFAKGCFKLVAVGFVAFLLLRSERDTVTDAMFAHPAAIPGTILGIVIRLVSGVATAFVLLAGLDLVWTRSQWMKRMRMSRRDLKDEMRQSEGDPLFKAKRRSVALDRSRRRMMADVPRATLVIANPTHFAIALRYVRQEGGAPVVIAKGRDLIALKIREIAEQNDIHVVENKLLARSMYDHVEVSQVIPPQFYKAVAEIIHYVQSRNQQRTSTKQETVMR
jgi:flagellar biosynthetic protein FlhB